MSKLGLIGLVLALGGCFGGGLDLDFGPDLGLQDAWTAPGLEGRYMVGSVFPIEITRPERPVDEYEVVSSDPEVLQITRTGIDFEATALALGETTVELREDGVAVRTYGVVVAEPNRMELSVEREDVYGLDLRVARTPALGEVVMLAGESLDVHVRYYDGGARVYGGDVLSFTTEMPAGSPEWSPQGNVIRVTPEAVGTYPISFVVGGLEETLDVIAIPAVASFALVEEVDTEDEDFQLLLDAEGTLMGQFIRSEALDAEGRLVHGTLPITWTIETSEETITGVGTHLGVVTDSVSMFPVTARLGELSATTIARGTEIYIAP